MVEPPIPIAIKAIRITSRPVIDEEDSTNAVSAVVAIFLTEVAVGVLLSIVSAAVDAIDLHKMPIPIAILEKTLDTMFLGLGAEFTVKLLFQLVVVKLVLVDA
jgi:hypothetical protein